MAESDACLCDDRDGEPAVLYFPQADIDLARLGGETSVLTMVERAGRRARLRCAITGRSIRNGSASRSSTRWPARTSGTRPIKAFPTWGDATHLIDMMDLRQTGELSWEGVARTDGRRPVVEGSQMLGQSIVAAMRHAPGRRVVSAHMLFLRGADAGRPLDFELAELSAGRTFTGVSAQVRQGGRCCAAGTLLLDTTAPPSCATPPTRPTSRGPTTVRPTTWASPDAISGSWTAPTPTTPTRPSDHPSSTAGCASAQVPEDPAIHAGLLAQFTGHIPIAAALRPHDGVGQDQAHRTLSMGINAINLSLHREVRADRWMLYRHLSTFAGDGMTHAECRVHDEEGQLLASFSVEAMVRPFGNGDRSHDERTAL